MFESKEALWESCLFYEPRESQVNDNSLGRMY